MKRWIVLPLILIFIACGEKVNPVEQITRIRQNYIIQAKGFSPTPDKKKVTIEYRVKTITPNDL